MKPQEQKNNLRRHFKALLLDKHYKAMACKTIVSRFEELLHTQPHPIIGAYWPLDHEFDTVPLLHMLHERGIKCALPRVEPGGLKFYAWKPGDHLIKGAYNVLEPSSDEVVSPNVIIVPHITCDAECNRLGSGKGHYDQFIRLLKAHPAHLLTVALCYSRQLSPKLLPIEAHDQKVDVVITEDGAYRRS